MDARDCLAVQSWVDRVLGQAVEHFSIHGIGGFCQSGIFPIDDGWCDYAVARRPDNWLDTVPERGFIAIETSGGRIAISGARSKTCPDCKGRGYHDTRDAGGKVDGGLQRARRDARAAIKEW